MKHTIEWTMTGTVSFDSDETTPENIRGDFRQAVDEGFDFLRKGDVDDFYVRDVDGEHVHDWSKSYFQGELFCMAGCGQRKAEP